MSWRIESGAIVEATPEVVFGFYADPATWGSWAHHTRAAHGPDPIVPGAVVDVKDAFGKTWHVRIAELVPGRRMTCVNRAMGFVITSTYDVRPGEAPGTSSIHHVIELGGPLQLLYRAVRPWYGRLLREETRTLAALAAGGPMHPAGAPA